MSISLSPAEVRAHVATAGRKLTPTWPLNSFIAVNPLSRYETIPFGEQPKHLPEVRFTRTEAEYLRAYGLGEINEDDVRRAIAQLSPELAATPAMGATGTSCTAVDVALHDLLAVHAESHHSGIDESLTPADELATRWLGILLGGPVWRGRTEDEPLYQSFLALAAHDHSLPRTARKRLAALPARVEDVILTVLNDADIPTTAIEGTITRFLSALPGWSSLLAGQTAQTKRVTLTDYVALRLALYYALNQPIVVPAAPSDSASDSTENAQRIAVECLGPKADADADADLAAVKRILMFLDEHTRLLMWQTAAEMHYRDGLFSALSESIPASITASETTAQLAFCIDARSEGIRRHLETNPHIDTFGFAGFFATALSYTSLESPTPRELYPALLSGGVRTTEKALDQRAGDRYLQDLFVRQTATASRNEVAHTPLSSFAWAESAGWITGLAAAARTYAPTLHHRVTARLRTTTAAELKTRIDVCEVLTVDEQTNLAEASVRMMGLIPFAPLVVFTGHRSTTQNNLYQAALDCGACGGNGGAPNARAAAAIFNNPPVRQALLERGITVPESTWFVAAEHDTSTDVVTILDQHLVPTTHTAAVNDLVSSLTTASNALTRERTRNLPGTTERTPLKKIRSRAHDWAEMYPEVGLAGNAALIVGPRSISRHADLDRRVFLHSYESAADPDGSALAAIMTAPLVVTQWINHQYYFSTIDPQHFGAGNKTLHNPVHDLGVVSGHAGDLQLGLPWQSVAAGQKLLHTPLRLSVLIQAPLDRIGIIISATDTLRNLFDNQWISLHARAQQNDPWLRYTRYGFTSTERTTS